MCRELTAQPCESREGPAGTPTFSEKGPPILKDRDLTVLASLQCFRSERTKEGSPVISLRFGNLLQVRSVYALQRSGGLTGANSRCYCCSHRLRSQRGLEISALI